MFILDKDRNPVDRLASWRWLQVERDRMTTFVRCLGRLVAYLPHNRRAYYAWALVVCYRPAQRISTHQFIPPQLRVSVLSKWEMGLVTAHWALGLSLGQPLIWVKKLQTAGG
jgi:hypothetical protein